MFPTLVSAKLLSDSQQWSTISWIQGHRTHFALEPYHASRTHGRDALDGQCAKKEEEHRAPDRTWVDEWWEFWQLIWQVDQEGKVTMIQVLYNLSILLQISTCFSAIILSAQVHPFCRGNSKGDFQLLFDAVKYFLCSTRHHLIAACQLQQGLLEGRYRQIWSDMVNTLSVSIWDSENCAKRHEPITLNSGSQSSYWECKFNMFNWEPFTKSIHFKKRTWTFGQSLLAWTPKRAWPSENTSSTGTAAASAQSSAASSRCNSLPSRSWKHGITTFTPETNMTYHPILLHRTTSSNLS